MEEQLLALAYVIAVASAVPVVLIGGQFVRWAAGIALKMEKPPPYWPAVVTAAIMLVTGTLLEWAGTLRWTGSTVASILVLPVWWFILAFRYNVSGGKGAMILLYFIGLMLCISGALTILFVVVGMLLGV